MTRPVEVGSWPVVVVGGGPAGIAAVTEAARAGLRCLLIDEAPRLGGQIYRQLPAAFGVGAGVGGGRDYRRGQRLRAGLERVAGRVEVWSGTSVIDVGEGPRVVCVSAGRGTVQVAADFLVVATGAYDRPVPFPGWTLPGVLTAGGAQVLMKSMRVRPGERAVVAGTGPLLLVVAYQLHRAGVRVGAVLEAGQSAFTAGSAAVAWRHGGLVVDAARYRLGLYRAGIPVLYNHTVFAAEGDGQVQRVTYGPVTAAGWQPVRDREQHTAADLLVVGFGFVPNAELSELAGCELVYRDTVGGWVPVRDAMMATSVPRVFAVGDGAGVAGSQVAVEEGRVAGITVAQRCGVLTGWEADRRRRVPVRRLRTLMAVRDRLDALSVVRAGVYGLAAEATVVCRCEEVSRAEVAAAVTEGARDLQAVKLLTRLGMGACQGRNCAPSAAGLVCAATGCGAGAVGRIHPRPPVKQVTLGVLAGQKGEAS